MNAYLMKVLPGRLTGVYGLLQGVGSAIVRLTQGKLHTPTVQALSIASLLKPVVQSGNLLLGLNSIQPWQQVHLQAILHWYSML